MAGSSSTEFRSREAQTFMEGLARPQQVQSELLLRRIIEPNIDCELGRKVGFDRIASVQDFQRAMPVAKYDAFAPMIDRIVQDGEQGLLTTAPVKRFFLTSGSTAKSKYIPVTSNFVRAKSRAFGIYWSAVFDQHPQAKQGRMVTNFSDSGEAVRSPGGLPCSSESAYWAGVTRATQLRSKPIIPKSVAQIGDSDARYYAIARILLEEDFSVIMTLNPSTILLLFQKIEQYAESLIADIEAGGIGSDVAVGPEVRRYVEETYAGDRQRAEVLRALVNEGKLRAHALWPQLDLGICWRSPMLQPYLDLLAPHFGPIAQRDYIMMASEGVMAIPIEDGRSGGPIAVGTHFYEFIPEEQYEHSDPDVLLPHQLEVGRSYVLVLTNGSGLYRYDIGDVVRVTGFVKATPCVEFLHRAGATCSLTGEKLTEDQVTAAMSDVAAALDVAVESFTVAPAKSGFPRYVAMVEFTQPPAREQLRAFVARFDEALEQRNVEYGSKRSSQRLAAPELWVLASGAFQTRRKERLAGGTSDSQIKPTHLTRDSGYGDQFEVLERFHAG